MPLPGFIQPEMDMQGLPASVVNFISEMQQQDSQQLMFYISSTPRAGKLTLIWRTHGQDQSIQSAFKTPESEKKYKSPSHQKRDSQRFNKYRQSWRKRSRGGPPPLQQKSTGLSPVVPDTPTLDRISASLLDPVDLNQSPQASSNLQKQITIDSDNSDKKDEILLQNEQSGIENFGMIEEENLIVNGDHLNECKTLNNSTCCSSHKQPCEHLLEQGDLEHLTNKQVNQFTFGTVSEIDLKEPLKLDSRQQDSADQKPVNNVLPKSSSLSSSDSDMDSDGDFSIEDVVFDKVTYDYRDSNRLKLRASLGDMLVFYDMCHNQRYIMDPSVDEDNYDFNRHMSVHQRFAHSEKHDIARHISWTGDNINTVMIKMKESMLVLLKRRREKGVPLPHWFRQ